MQQQTVILVNGAVIITQAETELTKGSLGCSLELMG